MDLAQRIRDVGFRRWYERQLIESHAWFVTCFVCMILVAITLEAFDVSEMRVDRPGMLLLAFGAGGGAVYAWLRYRRVLLLAEYLASLSTCGHCEAYGAFDVERLRSERGTAGGRQAGDPDFDFEPMRARCRKCGHEWRIE